MLALRMPPLYEFSRFSMRFATRHASLFFSLIFCAVAHASADVTPRFDELFAALRVTTTLMAATLFTYDAASAAASCLRDASRI